MEREYIVGLNRGVDFVQFNAEMIRITGSGAIPNRAVSVANPRPASQRLTHYMLTDSEAETLRSDNRVYCVELPADQRDDIEIGLSVEQTGNFTKTTESAGDFQNWGLPRVNATTNPYDGSDVSGGYTYHLDGTGVDVVIQDSGIEVDHPEWEDAQGNTRLQQIDWYDASGLTGTQSANHYRDYDGHGTHVAGTVAGKNYGWAKNARIYSVKLGGLEGSGDSGTGIPTADAFDVIKEWHRRKQSKFTPTAATYTPSTGVMSLTLGTHPFVVGDKIRIVAGSLRFTCAKDNDASVHDYPRGVGVPNSTGTDPYYDKEVAITGTTSTTITVNIGISSDTTTHKFVSALPGAIYSTTKKFRPTVVNMSWGYGTYFSNINGGTYRGTPWSGTSRETQYGMVGAYYGLAGYRYGTRVSSVDIEIQEMIDEGINICVAAGNSYQKIDVPGGDDYDNYYNSTFYGARYYHRGASPYDDEAIIVGNIDSQIAGSDEEQKNVSSECGPGVDVWAPGTDIMSACSNTNRFNGQDYYLNSEFKQVNISGTSMASPQVAGMCALYLQVNPEATPAEVKAWITGNAKTNLIYNPGDDASYTNNRSLLGGNNRFLFNKFNSRYGTTLSGKSD